MRTGDLSAGEFLSDMDDIYNVLVTLDFPDAITHGLAAPPTPCAAYSKKPQRNLTLTIRQKALEDRLNATKINAPIYLLASGLQAARPPC